MGTKLVQTVFGSVINVPVSAGSQEDGVCPSHTTLICVSFHSHTYGGLFFFKGEFFSEKGGQQSFRWWEKIQTIFSAQQTAYMRILPNTRTLSSQTLTDVLLKGCHDNTLKSPVCQRERKGLYACNHAGWCKTRTGSDFFWQQCPIWRRIQGCERGDNPGASKLRHSGVNQQHINQSTSLTSTSVCHTFVPLIHPDRLSPRCKDPKERTPGLIEEVSSETWSWFIPPKEGNEWTLIYKYKQDPFYGKKNLLDIEFTFF